jgi:isocitrate dehydrogenase
MRSGALASLRPPAAPRDELQVPVITGEGVGPELWAAARPVLDAAVRKAYGSRRALEWLEFDVEPPFSPEAALLPAEIVDAFTALKVGLRAPMETHPGRGSAGGELRARLGLALDVVELRRVGEPAAGPEPVLFVGSREGAACPVELGPGDSASVLEELTRELPEARRQLRFASRERVDAYRRSRGWPGGGGPEAALGVLVSTRQGTQRLVQTAILAATRARRARVTLVTDPRAWAVGEDTFVEWAYRLAEEELGSQIVFTGREFGRIAVRAGVDVAREAGAQATAAGVPTLDDVALSAALAGVVSGTADFDLAVVSPAAASAFTGALAVKTGGEALVPVAAVNPDTGGAVFETLHGTAPRHAQKGSANPTAMILAGEQLLRWVGWDEAADLVLPALHKARASGHRTADVPGGGSPESTAAFANAVQAAL